MNLFCFCLMICLLAACLAANAEPTTIPDSKPLPEFARGMDLSMLQHLEDHGVQYKEAGKVQDPLVIFRNHGVNYVRLRLFVSPNGKEGQVNTLPYTLKLAKSVKRAGLRFLLDFHYSDDWADPGHQTIPAAWKTLSHPQLVEQVFAYTRDTVAAFGREGCLPDMVQVGNEITNGMMWPAGGPLSDALKWNDITSQMSWPEGSAHVSPSWDAFADLVKAGIRGVRAADPKGRIKIMIHIDKGGNKDVSRYFFEHFRRLGVSFDIIGLSYYPFWHGSLPDLKANLAFLANTYHKDIIVAETGYDWNGGEQGKLPFPPTREGQKAFLEALIKTVAETPDGHGLGVFYWAPEWIMGAKWDGAKWSKVWENRALFDETGNSLPGLEAFGR
jgi:arabinogalactan endo-1,4-beta-galactosidase